jgi:hypothetical protein
MGLELKAVIDVPGSFIETQQIRAQLKCPGDSVLENLVLNCTFKRDWPLGG